jgi:Domain of unknown function (DUF6916)
MAASLTHEEFSRNLNTVFRLRRENTPDVELELTAVSEHLVTDHQERFSLTFRGPKDDFLGQGMQSLEHDGLQEVHIFLVPVGRDEAGIYYEAVFNRLRQTKQDASTA